MVSTPHLLRDCTFVPWVQARTKAQAAMRSLAVEGGLMKPDQPLAADGGASPEVADWWYRLMVGASVPHRFLNVKTLFRDPEVLCIPEGGRRRSRSASEYRVYTRILDASGEHLVMVLRATQAAFGRTPSGAAVGVAVRPEWPKPPPAADDGSAGGAALENQEAGPTG